ncbi:MAG: PAC2 family protein [Dehalococcoidia bacterium]|nr:PAC2 family protein [Dehalococcoidia bacterium]
MDKQGNVIITEKPTLRHPYMVCGISGWVDGGESATGSVRYLVSKLEAKRFAEIPIDKFHIFQVPGQLSLRPQIKIEDGVLKEHHFPQNQFFYWVNPNADNDLILFLGTEPNLNWEEYSDAILGVVEEFAVSRIYLLGGVLDKIPYTKEPRVSCLCSSDQLKEEMQKYSMQLLNYEGPGRWGTALLYTCQKKGFQMACVTVAVSYYPEFNVIISRNPKAIRAVVRRLNDLLHLNLDVSDLDREAEELETKLGFMASHNPEFRAYIEQMEKDFIEIKYEKPLDISANEAVHIAEEFLRENKQN